MLHVVRNGFPDSRSQVAPLLKQRMAIQVVQGVLAIVVVDVPFVTAHPLVDSFLQEAHHATLARFPAFLARAGDSVLVPLGHAALWTGIGLEDGKLSMLKPTKHRKPTADEFCSFMVHTPFDAESDKQHPPETQLSALGAMIQGLQRIPCSIRVKTEPWRSEMEKAKVADGDAAVAP